MIDIDYILEVFEEYYPDAKCELNYKNSFELLCAVMLSAQTTDKAVNKVTPSLFEKFPTPETLAIAPFDHVVECIRKIGIYKNKTKNLINLSKMLVEDYDGLVPDERSELVKLPGVGRKTANVVLAEYFNIPAFAVDTHVMRVSKRLGLVEVDDNVTEIESKLTSLISKEKWCKTHHQFILFGRYHCKARNPFCDNCKLKSICLEFN